MSVEYYILYTIMIAPLKIRGVSATVISRLRELIISGELQPGQKVSETLLASELGVSRQPLREAFRVLEQEYLLKNIPRKATLITELSIQDFREVYQARQMIETFSVDLIREEGIEDFSFMENAIEAEKELLTKYIGDDINSKLSYLRQFADFHLRLVETAGNSRFIHFYNIISSNLARYQFLHIFGKGRAAGTMQEHEDIFLSLKKKQYEKTKKLLRHHIDMVFESIKKNLVF